jgi:RHS repeat-associated protein
MQRRFHTLAAVVTLCALWLTGDPLGAADGRTAQPFNYLVTLNFKPTQNGNSVVGYGCADPDNVTNCPDAIKDPLEWISSIYQEYQFASNFLCLHLQNSIPDGSYVPSVSNYYCSCMESYQIKFSYARCDLDDSADLGCADDCPTCNELWRRPTPPTVPGKTTCLMAGPPCGMPKWWVTEPFVNLWVADEPAFYTTSLGQRFPFRLTYKQRDSKPLGNGPSAFVPATGWNHNWFSYIRFRGAVYSQSNSMAQSFLDWSATVYMPDGGAWNFDWEKNQQRDLKALLQPRYCASSGFGPYNSGGGPFYPDVGSPGTYPYVTEGVLNTRDTAGFAFAFPDGTRILYGQVTTLYPYASNGVVYGDALMTEMVDPVGNSTRFYYTDAVVNGATNYFLQFVVDPDGKTNTLSYDTNHLLTRVEMPGGKTVTMSYTNGFLESITDAAGMTNSFGYDTLTGYLTTMVTPYGTTAFAHKDTIKSGLLSDLPALSAITNPAVGSYEAYYPGVGGGPSTEIGRAMIVTEPDTSRQIYLYRPDGARVGVPGSCEPSAIPTNTPFGTLDTSELNLNNTYYWGKKQCESLPAGIAVTTLTNLTEGSYKLARLKHFLLDDDHDLTTYVSFQRDPSPDGVTEGFKTWYDHTNKPAPFQIRRENPGGLPPTERLVGVVANVLPDGSTRYSHSQYDDFGNLTSATSTYTLPDGTIGTRTTQRQYYQLIASETLTNTSYWYYTSLSNAFDAEGNSILTLNGFTNAVTQWTDAGLVFTRALPRRMRAIATDAESQSATNWYNSRQQLTASATASGLTTTYGYGPDGFLASILVNEIQATSRFKFIDGRLAIHTNELGLVTTFTYDGLDRMTSFAHSNGCVSNIYSRLDLVAQKDKLGHWAYAGYDAMGRMTNLTNLLGDVTTFAHCSCGGLEEIIDPLTNRTVFVRDQNNLVTAIQGWDAAAGSGSAFCRNITRDVLGRPTSLVDNSGEVINLDYNHQGLLTTIKTGGNVLSHTVYDIHDRPLWRTNCYGLGVTNLYDRLARLTTMATPKGLFVLRHDARGLAEVVDPMVHTNTYERDAAGRVRTTRNANFETATNYYAPDGSLTNFTDSKGARTTWTYDPYGRVLKEVNNLGTTVWTNGYDAGGAVVRRWNVDRGLTTNSYDAAGRLTNALCPGNLSFRCSYDKLGRLLSMTDGLGTTAFAYTNFGAFQGALLSEDGPWSADKVTRGYDGAARLSSLAVEQPSGQWSHAFAYDSLNRLQSVASPAGTFALDYAGPGGRPTRFTLPGGSLIDYAYTGAGEIESTSLTDRLNNLLDQQSYSYNGDGNRTRATRANGSYVDYDYDKIGQVLTATGHEPGGTPRKNENFKYGYDRMGNLIGRTNNTLAQQFTPDSLNRLTTVTRSSSTLTVAGNLNVPVASFTVNRTNVEVYADFTYAATNIVISTGTTYLTNVIVDKLGEVISNVVAVSLPSTVTLNYDNNENLTNTRACLLMYDSLNQLTNISYTNTALFPTGGRTELRYDGFGRLRVRREYTNSASPVLVDEVRYVYCGLDVIQERDGNNNPRVSYTLGHGLAARTDTNGSAFYHTDGNGNVTALVDGNGRLRSRYLYDPFGSLLAKHGDLADANTRRFSGQEFHARSGLYYYGFRWYDPNFQRWINADPIGLAGGRNKHTFVGNKPIDQVDYLGLKIYVSIDPFPSDDPRTLGPYASINSDGSTEVVNGADYNRVLWFSEGGRGAQDLSMDFWDTFTFVRTLPGDALSFVKTTVLNVTRNVVPAWVKCKPRNRPGNRGHPDHQADVQGPGRAQTEAQAKHGETVLTEQPVQGYPGVNRRADNQIVGLDGKTRVVVESERRPNGTYHKKRIEQLEAAGIEVQTRPIPPKE